MIHLQRMRAFHDKDTGAQPTPSTIPQRAMDADPSGIISTYQRNGDTQTSSNAFFENLGTNGRTCFTCHQTQTGWSVIRSQEIRQTRNLPQISSTFLAWTNLSGTGGVNQNRLAVAPGETIFNSPQINITSVMGLNDVLGQQSIPGFCGTSHDTPNVGNHSVKAPLNIGIANAGPNSPPALDWSCRYSR